MIKQDLFNLQCFYGTSALFLWNIRIIKNTISVSYHILSSKTYRLNAGTLIGRDFWEHCSEISGSELAAEV